MAALFADIRTPYVNEATLRRVMASRVRDNIFQGIFTKPGEAVTEQYSTDVDAAQIQVIRVKPHSTDAREIGSDTNGAWFNSTAVSYPTTEAYPINIVTTIDDCIDIPESQQGMMSVSLVDAELQNLSGRVNRNVNALTIASQLCKNFNDIATSAITSNWVTLPASNANYQEALIEAGSFLDCGNINQGVDAYPDDQRAVIIRPKAKAEMLKKGQIIIGGSDYAQRILRNGGLDVDTRPEVSTSAYVGEVANMPCYVAAPAVWSLAEKYLGLDAGDLDGVEMMVVSAIGTGRALAFNGAIKIVDSPLGQGRRIQPKYRMGAECWDSLSVVPIVANGFTNPSQSGAQLSVIAPGSRT